MVKQTVETNCEVAVAYTHIALEIKQLIRQGKFEVAFPA